MGLLGDWIGKDTTQVLDDFGRGLLMTNDFGKGAAYGFQAMDDRRKKKLVADAYQGATPDAFRRLLESDPEAAMNIQAAKRDRLAPYRSVAMRAINDPKVAQALQAKALSEGWGDEIDTPEKLSVFAYQGVKPEDVMKNTFGSTFDGTSMDAQVANILVAAEKNPALKATPQYKVAVAQYTQPRVTMGPDGRVITIQPTLPDFGGTPPQSQPLPTPPPMQPSGQGSPQTRIPVSGANVSITGDPTSQPIPAEQAARVGLTQSFLEQAPGIVDAIKGGKMSGVGSLQMGDLLNPGKVIDATKGSINTALGRGERGEILRRLSSGQDALIRNLTGAGMPAEEARRYADRYSPSWDDSDETMLSKANQLVYELQNVRKTVMGGRRVAPEISSPSTPPPSQYMPEPQPPSPIAAGGEPPLVTTQQQFDALPRGTMYKEDDGKVYYKP